MWQRAQIWYKAPERENLRECVSFVGFMLGVLLFIQGCIWLMRLIKEALV